MTESKHPRIEKLNRRRLANMITLQNNIVHNEHDLSFIENENEFNRPLEIIYIFDQTVVEMFISQDGQTRKYAAAFHTEPWRSTSNFRPIEKRESQWISINCQTGMIAGEYLMSGKLPGQIDGQIYMTGDHFEEFARGIDRIYNKAKGAVADHGSFSDKLDRIVKTIDHDNFEIEEDGYLRRDLSELFAGGPDSAGAREEFTRTRYIASALVECEDLMRLKQLDRVTSREVLERLVSLSIRFPRPGDTPMSSAFRREWTKLRGQWKSWLNQANELRGRKGAHSREPRNLEADAESIAWIQWIARTSLAPHQRVAFVTGDSLLIAAYNKWHKDRVLVDPSEPRILREVQQFAPILNLETMDNDIRDGRLIYEMLREGIEAPLMAFNLSPEGAKISRRDFKTTPSDREWKDMHRVISSANRNDLALRLDGTLEKFVDSPEVAGAQFSGRLDPSWYRKNRQVFGQIARSFREYERIVIGLSTPAIETRARAIRDDIGTWDDGVDLNERSSRYILRLLNNIVQRSVDVWFPVALGQLERMEAGSNDLPRTPRGFNLQVEDGDATVRLVDLVEVWAKTGDVPRLFQTEQFRARRDLVFAVAALAALRLGRWERARRFGELAAAVVRNRHGTEDEESYQEFRYLKALTCRMVVGAAGPSDLLGNDIWAERLDEGVAELSDAIEYHRAREQNLLVFRAISERVALRGFYASWWAVLERKLPTSPSAREQGSGFSRDRAVKEYEALLMELRAGLDLSQQLDLDVNPSASENFVIQLNANVAAAFSLSTLCPDFSPYQFQEDLGEAHIRRIVDWWLEVIRRRDRENCPLHVLPKLVRLQLAVFLRHFSGAIVDTGTRVSSPNLRLDRDLIEIMTAKP